MDELLEGEPSQTRRYPQAIDRDWTSFFGASCAGISAPPGDDRDFGRFEEINREVFEAFQEAGMIRINYETTLTVGKLKT